MAFAYYLFAERVPVMPADSTQCIERLFQNDRPKTFSVRETFDDPDVLTGMYQYRLLMKGCASVLKITLSKSSVFGGAKSR